jgi:hypothetical protein
MKLTKSKIITTTCNDDRGEWGIEEVSYGYYVVDKEKGTTCGLFMEGEMQF